MTNTDIVMILFLVAGIVAPTIFLVREWRRRKNQ